MIHDKFSKIENKIKELYKKDKFIARFVFFKHNNTLYHIKPIYKKYNGKVVDYSFAILNYSDDKNSSILELIQKMYNVKIQDSTNSYKRFWLRDKETNKKINEYIDFLDNNFISVSCGIVFYD